jgi:hypothetical protein
LIKHCQKTSEFKNRGHFFLEKNLLKSFRPSTFSEISLLKKVTLRGCKVSTCLLQLEIHKFMSSSGSGTVINYGSGSDFLANYGSGYAAGSTSQKLPVPVPVPVPVPQHWYRH